MDILFDSKAIYQNHNLNNNRSKSIRIRKHTTYIKPIWENSMKKMFPISQFYFSLQRPKSSPSSPASFRTGMHKYTEFLKNLCGWLLVIMGEEVAGNDNLYNEKASIMQIFSDMHSNFILQNLKKSRWLNKNK